MPKVLRKDLPMQDSGSCDYNCEPEIIKVLVTYRLVGCMDDPFSDKAGSNDPADDL